MLGTLLGATASAAPSAGLSVERLTGLAPAQVTTRDVCPPVAPGRARCFAQAIVLRSTGAPVRPRLARRATFTQVFGRDPIAYAAGVAGRPGRRADDRAAPADATAAAATTAPQPSTPAFLQQAYDLGYLSQTGGGGDTVAVVDAYDDPNAEADMAVFRSHFGLAPCSSASGCFRKVDQYGLAGPLPPSNASWGQEESLDLDAVSALCPNCHVLLVETDSNGGNDLYSGIAAAESLGADQISNSWGAVSSTPPSVSPFTATVLAGTGDSGYPGAGQDTYPAAFAAVTAVGGTTLTPTTSGSVRGVDETAWSLNSTAPGWGGGSGCDLAEAKPAYQTDTGCSGRAYADVSADGDPSTGLTIYDSAAGGWMLMGGTSLATPLVAAFDAVTGASGTTPAWAYHDAALLNDVQTGSDGTCAAAILYICNAGPGYDGPTGVGSISGDIAPGAPGVAGPAVGGASANTYTLSTAATTAQLRAGVYPNGLPTSYAWQFGPTTAYGQTTAAVEAGSGPGLVAASGTLTGLAPQTAYHYRLVATNADGTSYGYDATLTTTAAPIPVPSSAGAPSIAGLAVQGHLLRASSGGWAPATGVSLAYRWERSSDGGRSWTAIAGADHRSYSAAAADVDAQLRVIVIAGDAAGSTAAVSPATQKVGPGGRAGSLRGGSRRGVAVSAAVPGARQVRISTAGQPRDAMLLVRVGRAVHRTRRTSLVVAARAGAAVWVAWRVPGRGAPRWVRVSVR
jgi:hypothetical protein